jgi:hypothetical protein
MTNTEHILTLAEHIRGVGILGKPGSLSRLFDYLVERTVEGTPPKEIEIAIDVFGKDKSFAVAQDSTVRVYVHKLRRKLEELHARAECTEVPHLVLPKGEYRFIVATAGGTDGKVLHDPAAAAPPVAQASGSRVGGFSRSVFVGLCCAILCGIALTLYWRFSGPAGELEAVRASPLWADILDDNRPIIIAVGDYYIFGETDSRSGAVTRMVRDFGINSARDLEDQLQTDPRQSSSYEDLDLAYLPTSTAFALRDVLTILAAPNQPLQRAQIVLASDVTTDMLRASHLIYIGFISGMRQLQELAFQRSRLSVGSSYDELIDSRTGHHYVSQAGRVPESGTYRDYGFFSSFPGPTGNRFVIIAGTRDVAVMETAQALTRGETLRDLGDTLRNASFEGLYEVAGLNRSNLSGRLIFGAPVAGSERPSVGRSAASNDEQFLAGARNDKHR